jgi:hypothetical protein
VKVNRQDADLVLGETAVLGPGLVNTLRWGFTRQRVGTIGNCNQEVILFRGLTGGFSSPTCIYGSNFQVPTHNLVDDLSWHHGPHSFSFGGTVRLIRNSCSRARRRTKTSESTERLLFSVLPCLP